MGKPTVNTLVAGDVQYLRFYLKETDPLTGDENYYDLSTASSLTFRMRNTQATSNTIDEAMSVVTATLGLCQVKVTVPVEGEYNGEVEVFDGSQNITWKDIFYKIEPELG